MRTIGFTFWQDGEMWLGHLDDYPDYLTQGTSFEDLKEHLLDLYQDLSSGDFCDAVLAESRARDPRESLASVKRRLKVAKADG